MGYNEVVATGEILRDAGIGDFVVRD